MSRDTTTGSVLEQMVEPALKKGGYKYETQVNIGNRFGGGRHIADIVATNPNNETFLISLKWQQVSGTAEQKVPFEVICLIDAVLASNGRYKKAYVVLGGNGWKLRDFYTEGGLLKYLKYKDHVSILTLEDFIFRANGSKL